ncbi:MAG: efflux RND transporter periplasmic adaptor subunit [Planctomycetota bacterium]|nr:efflux RND transporter periplasmic adaptor subunit [Planctomycetota bacterium]
MSQHFLPALSLTVAALTGCMPKPAPLQLPPPPVVVASPTTMPHARSFQAVGTTSASAFVEIRARVPGYLRSMDFTPGSQVEAGQLLFTIEQDTYKAVVESAKADLAIAKADLERANADLARVQKALETNAVSEMEVDQRRADSRKAAARVDAAEAQLGEAELQLSYTEIHAPIAGRIGKQTVDVGNLVGAPGTPNILTTITQSTPIYVDFDVPERLLVGRLREIRRLPPEQQSLRPTLSIAVKVEGDAEFGHEGKIDFVDNQVDARTGTIRVRGIIPNDDGTLVPGLFVRMQVLGADAEPSLFIEETGIGTDLAGKYVFTVDADGLVTRQGIEVGDSVGRKRLVTSGLTAEATYIVEGLAKARAGMKVVPQGEGEPPAPKSTDGQSNR